MTLASTHWVAVIVEILGAVQIPAFSCLPLESSSSQQTPTAWKFYENMDKLSLFDYSQGSAFVHEGYLYYSPNCSRAVVIPPRPDTTVFPFSSSKLSPLSASQFRQPIWWSTSWGWLSFVPLQPTFTSFPFEPLSWMPTIVTFEASVRNAAGVETMEKRFKMQDDTAATWFERETLIVAAADALRLRHSINSTAPPLPSSFGFRRAHKSHATAKQMIQVSRNWFGILMGWLASIIAEVGVSEFQKTLVDNGLHPYWYRFLANEGMSQAWLDGLQSSPVCSYHPEVLRAGVVIPWEIREHKRPSLEFFLHHNIPLFFPWSAREEELISQNASLAYLRPPNELIQQALSFLTTNPSNLPLAAYTAQCFFQLKNEDKRLSKETLVILRLRYSSSFVLKYMLNFFMTAANTLEELDQSPNWNEAVRKAIESIPAEQRRAAEAAASLPQQPMLEKPPAMSGLPKGLITDWKEFFRSRAKRYEEWLVSASDAEKQACESRKQKPPTVKTKMFVWEIVESPGSMTMYMRNRQTKSMFADLVDDDDERVYDAWTNEWDFFPDFVIDDQPTSEAGVPALRRAPPMELRPFCVEDDDDASEDCYNSQPSSEPTEIIYHSSTASSSQMIPPSSHPEQVEEHPEFSRDMEETLRFMYGWERSYGAQLPSSSSPMDWRGVEKVLGFSSSPIFQQSEQPSIISFVSSLVRGPKFVSDLPSDLHDLDTKNHGFLGGIFPFREILRLEKDMFIFHSPQSTACNWVLGIQSAAVALYIVRFLICNHCKTIFTVAHHLLERGIPFRTLLYLRAMLPQPSASLPSFVQCHPSPYRETKYHFTISDFESSMLRCKTVLNKIGRAALLQGGILGRIAREFLSIDTPLEGPSGWAAVDRNGFFVKAENAGYEYWDDELTENEITVICGTYTLYTGYGAQIKTVSWFPPPSIWRKHGFGWYEWTGASESYFTILLGKIQRGEAQPRNSREWRDSLRGFGGTRNLLDANDLRAHQFMEQYCPVRQRT